MGAGQRQFSVLCIQLVRNAHMHQFTEPARTSLGCGQVMPGSTATFTRHFFQPSMFDFASSRTQFQGVNFPTTCRCENRNQMRGREIFPWLGHAIKEVGTNGQLNCSFWLRASSQYEMCTWRFIWVFSSGMDFDLQTRVD